MVKVKFAGRSILFTGDASPQLFAEMLNDHRYCYDLKDVDCLVLPHHGSNQSGELMTFHAANPEMCLICSNPADTNDKLPWNAAANLIFNVEDVIVNQHDVATRGKNVSSFLPVFVTCKSAMFYKLHIDISGNVNLFNGTSFKPCFIGKFTSNKLDKRLKSESKQMSALYSVNGDIAKLLLSEGRMKNFEKMINMKTSSISECQDEVCKFSSEVLSNFLQVPAGIINDVLGINIVQNLIKRFFCNIETGTLCFTTLSRKQLFIDEIMRNIVQISNSNNWCEQLHTLFMNSLQSPIICAMALGSLSNDLNTYSLQGLHNLVDSLFGGFFERIESIYDKTTVTFAIERINQIAQTLAQIPDAKDINGRLADSLPKIILNMVENNLLDINYAANILIDLASLLYIVEQIDLSKKYINALKSDSLRSILQDTQFVDYAKNLISEDNSQKNDWCEFLSQQFFTK